MRTTDLRIRLSTYLAMPGASVTGARPLQLDSEQQLATVGPFRCLRNPIYMGLNLLALGSDIWAPGAMLWIAVALMLQDATGNC